MNISVAMATYNGEKYLSSQLDSIIPQLTSEDQIIISDDNSTDNTISIINEYINKDSRIKLFTNSEKGILSNFENAIKKSGNDIIFLCDQDDIWLDNKIKTIKEYFESNEVSLIMSDAYIVDSNLEIVNESFYEFRNSKKGIITNIIKNSYLGCAIAFRKELKNIILPIPPKVPMHDMWIGITAEIYGEVMLIPEKLIYYRRHGENATEFSEKISKKQKLCWRINLINELAKIYKENKKIRCDKSETK